MRGRGCVACPIRPAGFTWGICPWSSPRNGDWPEAAAEVDVAVVLITGSDRGIGQALCLAYHARGDRVIAACLDDSEALRGLGIRVEPDVDVTSDAAVRGFARRLADAGTVLDILVNNAGVMTADRLGALDYGAVRRQFEVNVLGPLRVTEALLDRLRPGSKAAFITSRVGSLGDNLSGGFYGYRISKCAANMVAVNLGHDLRKRGVATAILHPGMVATDMTIESERAEAKSPGAAAQALIERIDRTTLESPLAFWHAPDRAVLPW